MKLATDPRLVRLTGASDELAWSRVKGGKVLGRLDDVIGRTAFYVGDLDPKISWVCTRIVKRGDTVLDIGANIGVVSLRLSKLVGPNGSVHSFEPNPELYRCLTEAIQRSHAPNIHPHPVALGAKDAQLELRIRAGNTGSGSLVLHGDATDCKTISVPVRTLDAMVAEAGIRSIKLIKIDVEGFEAEVFRGGLEMLKNIRPQAILFEFIEKSGEQLSEQPIFQILGEAGYGFFALPKCRWRMHLERCDPKRHNYQAITDFLAVQKNDQFEKLAAAVRARG